MKYRFSYQCSLSDNPWPDVVELDDSQVYKKLSDITLYRYCNKCEDGGCMQRIIPVNPENAEEKLKRTNFTPIRVSS